MSRFPDDAASISCRGRSPVAAGVPAASCSTSDAPRLRKIAPQAAIPTAMPTCRNVSLIPAAMPLCSLGTTLRATSAITGLSSPTPAPATRNPPSIAVHSSVGSIPPISRRPTPVSPSPTDMITRAGSLASNAPPAAAAKKLITVNGR